jgi:Lrp/AsnC family leucine-responsive transcriptional regulator
MDELDYKITAALSEEGRITWADLAARVGLSAPAAADRVRRLEERGVIRGYAALVDPESVGQGLTAFVAVTLERPQHRQDFLDVLSQLPQVLECHHTAGDDDYLLKIRCSGTRELERLVSDEIKSLRGIARTRTTIVLSTMKETPVVPLPAPKD